MFIITVRGEDRIFYNKKTDDFLRNVPTALACEISDMQVKAFSDADEADLRVAQVDNASATKDFAIEDGMLKLKNLDLDPQTDLCVMTPVVISWPYANNGTGDSAGKFSPIKI